MGGLSALGMVFDLLSTTFPDTPRIRADRVLFGALLQSGAEHFEMGPGEPALWRSSFMNDRMTAISATDYEQARSLVESLFSEHLPPEWLHSADYGYAWAASTFLTDLIFALRRRVGVAMLLEPTEFKTSQLPLELRQLVNNVVSSITWEEASLPVPVGSVSGETASVLREVVESDLFRKYSSTHERLEMRSEDHRSVMDEMVTRAGSLVAGFRDRISLRRSVVGMLPGVATAFSGGGKGSAPWAKLAAVLGDAGLWQQRRVAIYRCGPMLHDLLLRTMIDIGGRLKAEDEKRKRLTGG
jgi:hypothetical protein